MVDRKAPTPVPAAPVPAAPVPAAPVPAAPTYASARIKTFRNRLLSHDRLLGTFVKTPHPVVAEVLGHSRLDVICLDAEHAPFDRTGLDGCILASRAADLPNLVRVPRNDPVDILQALDLGATGVVVPHVHHRQGAESAAQACRYGKTGRGYSGSTRAAAYTTKTMSTTIADANASVVLIVQIEDEAALSDLDAIASVEGVDCLFIGRADLTVSLGASTFTDNSVMDAVTKICEAGRRHNRTVGMFTSTLEEIPHWSSLGASLFLLESDQQWILAGAQRMVDRFAAFSDVAAGR